MSSPPPLLSLAPDAPFKYLGGDPAVDLVNTVDWTARGLVNERLIDYDRVTRWAEGAGLFPAARAARLRRQAAERPREAKRVLVEMRRLRWILQRVFEGSVGRKPDRAAIAELNDLLTDALGRLRLEPNTRSRSAGAAAAWTWDRIEDELALPLWTVARAAAQLLTSEEAGRLRVCGGENCGWMYVDRSRNGLRRWCAMETCGTAEKSRRRRERTTERRAPG